MKTDRDEVRNHVTRILINEDHSAISTDGSRLHLVAKLHLKPGYYQVYKLKQTFVEIERVSDINEYDYPECDDIIKDSFSGNNLLKVVRFEIDHDNPNTISIAMTKIVRAMNENSISWNYLNDLPDGEWTSYVREEMPLGFYRGKDYPSDIRAVIMPMRTKMYDNV